MAQVLDSVGAFSPRLYFLRFGTPFVDRKPTDNEILAHLITELPEATVTLPDPSTLLIVVAQEGQLAAVRARVAALRHNPSYAAIRTWLVHSWRDFSVWLE